MREFFYKTRNIIGIILIISPVPSAFSTDRPFLFYLLLLAGTAAAVPLHCIGILFLPFRLWLFSACLAAAAGLALAAPSAAVLLPFDPVYLSALFQGAACGGLLLLLPPVMITGWFRRSKNMVLGILWSVSLLLMPLWQTAFHQAAGWVIAASALSMAAGILFLQRPPVNFRFRENPLLLGRSGTFVKPSIYTSSIAASLGMVVSLSILMAPSGQGVHSLSGEMQSAQVSMLLSGDTLSALPSMLLSGLAAALPYLFLAAAPVLTALFVERKGVFSGCVLLIFLCESAVLCLGSAGSAAGGFADSTVWTMGAVSGGAAAADVGSRVLPLAGRCLLAAAAGCLPVVLPILNHYLYGSISFLESFGRLVFFLPAGLLASMPFCYLAAEGELLPEDPVIFLLFLLVLSFFCIFSAWKHRFIILKNKIL
ncbi:MAG: hypothetical protein PUE84_09525 [Firmicutes bacterium]|nr:hypothetical protein [Bacillota bacterium]